MKVFEIVWLSSYTFAIFLKSLDTVFIFLQTTSNSLIKSFKFVFNLLKYISLFLIFFNIFFANSSFSFPVVIFNIPSTVYNFLNEEGSSIAE